MSASIPGPSVRVPPDIEAELASFADDADDTDGLCHTCHGEGWGIVGTDWDCVDGINGPFDGETERCPNCHGSGRAKDCWFW